MALLKRLKSLLGLEEGRSSSDRREDDTVGVTVEHERNDDRTASEPAATAEAEPEGPPIDSGSEAGSTERGPTETENERPIDDETATDPEEAPPGTDAPGTETAEPAPAETGESAEEGAGVDGTVDVEPDVESPDPEPDIEDEAESKPADLEDESGSEPEVTDPIADDEEPTDEALQDIKGIGPSYETKLSEAGVETVDELADADADELADDTGLSTKRIRGWIDRARSR